jgi:hypothetical protein
MDSTKWQRWLLYSVACLALTVVVLSRAEPVASQGSPNTLRFVYRVLEVPPDTRSSHAALDEYGHAGGELVAFEMGELQAPRLIFKKASSSAS